MSAVKMTKIDKQEYEKVPVNEKQKLSEKGGVVEAPRGLGARHVQALLAFMCMTITLMARAHPSVTVVAMLDPAFSDSHSHTATSNAANYTTTDSVNITSTCTSPSSMQHIIDGRMDADERTTIVSVQHVNDTTSNNTTTDAATTPWHVYRKYKWDKRTQEVVLGAFFAGYALAMWPMGLLVQRLGGKRPLQLGLLVTGLVQVGTPSLAAVGGWKAVAASRFVTGLAQSGTYPSAMALVARWVPAGERATLGTYVFTGAMVGNVLALQLGGTLAVTSWGWPAMFWVTGALCLLACALFTALGHRDSIAHPTISHAERNYIIGKVFTHKEKALSTPWRRIMSSRAVWAAFVAQLGSSFMFLFVFTQAPSYLHFILSINVKSSGLLSSVPYAANFIASAIISNVSEYCTNRRLVSIRHARLICNTIGAVIPSACLIGMGYTRRPELAVPLLVLTMGAHGASHTGWMVNYMDLSPRYSGALMATGNTIMNCAGIGLPLLVANVVTDVYNGGQWRVVMLCVSALTLVSNAVFVAFMSADVERWDHPHPPYNGTGDVAFVSADVERWDHPHPHPPYNGTRKISDDLESKEMEPNKISSEPN